MLHAGRVQGLGFIVFFFKAPPFQLAEPEIPYRKASTATLSHASHSTHRVKGLRFCMKAFRLVGF